MFEIESDNTIHLTRGDVCFFGVSANDAVTGETLVFQPGDIVRFKVFGKKNCKNVVLEKDFLVETPSEEVWIYLDENDTTIGDIINKPTTYWYEVSLNPDIREETFIGISKDGEALLILYPEGAEVPKTEIKPEDVPVVDKELNALSDRPVANSAVARAVIALLNRISVLEAEVKNAGATESAQEGE